MGFIELNPGCPRLPAEVSGCYGPFEPYYTIYGTPVDYYYSYMLFSVGLGFLVFYWLNRLAMSGRIRYGVVVRAVAGIAFSVVLFVGLVKIFPIWVVY